MFISFASQMGLAITLTVAFLAYFFGGKRENIAAWSYLIISLVALILSRMFPLNTTMIFLGADVIILSIFIHLLWKSTLVWPYFAVSAQLISVVSNINPAVYKEIIPYISLALLRFSAYLVLSCLVYGLYERHKARKAGLI